MVGTANTSTGKTMIRNVGNLSKMRLILLGIAFIIIMRNLMDLSSLSLSHYPNCTLKDNGIGLKKVSLQNGYYLSVHLFLSCTKTLSVNEAKLTNVRIINKKKRNRKER